MHTPSRVLITFKYNGFGNIWRICDTLLLHSQLQCFSCINPNLDPSTLIDGTAFLYHAMSIPDQWATRQRQQEASTACSRRSTWSCCSTSTWRSVVARLYTSRLFTNDLSLKPTNSRKQGCRWCHELRGQSSTFKSKLQRLTVTLYDRKTTP